MSDVHPYPQDITADPFFVFGGLFSRKIISQMLAKVEVQNSTIFSEMVELSRQCSKESALQQGIEDIFNDHGFVCRRPKNEVTCDRILQDLMLVEIKLNKNNNDPQFWHGSQEDNAVLQTRRYLNDSKFSWALLTNGQVFRLMHKSHQLNFIDFWACDAARSGTANHNDLFLKLMTNQSFREELLSASEKERIRFTAAFQSGVANFWEKYKKRNNRPWNVGLVKAVLSVAFIRYLEDIGVIKGFESENFECSFLSPMSAREIIRRLKKITKRSSFIDTAGNALADLYDESTIESICTVLGNDSVEHDLKNIFWDQSGAIDLSDLGIQFFGDAYQLFANKNDVNGADGQYFTGSDLAKETALYFIEDEARSVSLQPDEIIFDPFVGSGQLLRALVPFFHLLLQGELRAPGIVQGMRTMAHRLRGTDVDENACWLAKLSLMIVTAESDSSIMYFADAIKKVDVFEACFKKTEGAWMSSLGISGTVRAVITNPPWKQLEIHSKQLYANEMSCALPSEKNPENWRNYKSWLKNGGSERTAQMSKKLKDLRAEHKETFHRTGGAKINVALSALDLIDRLPGSRNKKWVCFLPDTFFVGKSKIRSVVNVRRYYSFVDNVHFSGADRVMKYGVVFGGGSRSPRINCHPNGESRKYDVTEIFNRLGILPVFGSVDEALVQNVWFEYSQRETRWSDGEFNKDTQRRAGATLAKDGKGTPIRQAKGSNDDEIHSVTFVAESLTYWKDVDILPVPHWRTIVRDSRPNSTQVKILWSGKHKPGSDGIPRECLLEDSWNYLVCSKERAEAYSRILNTPLADIAVRSVAGKRHISPHHLNVLGLPELTDEQVRLVNLPTTYIEQTAMIFLTIYRLSTADAERILKLCPWLSGDERAGILRSMSLDLRESAADLIASRPRRRRGQIVPKSRTRRRS